MSAFRKIGKGFLDFLDLFLGIPFLSVSQASASGVGSLGSVCLGFFEERLVRLGSSRRV